MAGETVNRIGLAVGVDDPGGQGLDYLTRYNDQLERAERLTRQLNAASARVTSPRQGDRLGQLVREEERARETARRREETAETGHAGRRSQRVRASAREEVVTKEQVVRQLDALSARSAETQKRRASDVTNHAIAEGRRASDVLAQLNAKSTQELHNLYAALKSSGSPYAEDAKEIIARRMPGENPYAPGGPRDPNSPENRAMLQAARRARNIIHEPNVLRDEAEGRAASDPRAAFLGVLQRAQTERTARQTAEAERYAQAVGTGQQAFRGVLQRAAQEQADRLRQTLPAQLRATPAPDLRGGLDQLQSRRNQERDAAEQVRRDALAREFTFRRNQTREEQSARARAEGAGAAERAERERLAGEAREAQRRRESDPAYVARREREAREQRERREREAAERARTNLVRERETLAQGAREQAERRIQQAGLRSRAEGTFPEYGPPEAPSLRARRLEQERAGQARVRPAGQLPQYGPGRGEFLDADAATVKVGRLTDGLARMRKEAEQVGFRQAGTRIGREADRIRGDIGSATRSVAALRAELGEAAPRRLTADIRRDIEANTRQVNNLRGRLRQLREEQANAPRYRPPGGGGPGGGRFGGDDPFSAVNTTGRIVRNILLFTVVRAFTQDLGQFVTASLEAARVAERTEKQMEFTSKAAHVTFEGNLRVAQSLRDTINVTGAQSAQITSEATRFAARANRRGEVGSIVRAAADLAASRGFENEKIPQLLETLTRGERGIEQIIGKRPEEIYEEAARTRLRGRPDYDALQVGKRATRDYKSEEQQVRDYVEALSEEAKAQLVLNEYMRVAQTVQGAGESRARSLEGQIERARTNFEALSVSTGRFIFTFRPFVSLLERVNNLLGGLDAGKLRLLGSGPGGRITDLDVSEYGRRAADSPAARAQRHLESFGALEAAGAVGSVGAFFGGRSPARVQVAQQTANQVFDRVFASTANQALAQSEATAAANAAKPGIIRSIGTGFVRVTAAVSGAVLDLLSWASGVVGAEGVSARSSAAAARIRGGAGAQIGTAERAGANAAAAGGVAGAALGATVGYMLAERLNVGPITATALTVTGAIVGTALGTAAGSALGTAAAAGGGALAVTAGTVAAAGVVGGVAVAGIYDAIAQTVATGSARQGVVNAWEDLLDQLTGATTKRLAEAEGEAKGAAEQAAQKRQAEAEGRLYYVREWPNAPQQLFYDEGEYKEALGRGQAPSDFVVTTAGGRTRYLDTRADYNRGNLLSRAEYQAEVRAGRVSPGDYRERIFSDDELTESRAVTAAGEGLTGDRKAADEMWADIRKREEAGHQELIGRTSAALGRLRETVVGSVRLVEEIGQTSAGPNNPFVKILADGETAGERMAATWGHLGEEVTRVFTELEKRRIGFARVAADFDNLRRGQDVRDKRAKDAAERDQPGLGRVEQAQLSVQQAIVAAARELPELARKYNALMGVTTSKVADVLAEVAQLQANTGQAGYTPPGEATGVFGTASYRANLLGFSAGPRTSTFVGPDGKTYTTTLDAGRQNDYAKAERNRLEFQGLSPRAQLEAQRATQGALFDIIDQLTPAQIRANPALRRLYVGALNFKAGDAQRRVDEEIQKAAYEGGQQDRLSANLREADERRREALARGEDAREVGRQYDLFLIGRTEGISPRDLTDAQYRERDSALSREAGRVSDERDEGAKAAKEGVEVMKAIRDISRETRDALLGGLESGQFSEVLVRVENDTPARADAQDLEDAATGGYRVPRQRTRGSGSYGGSYSRYGKKGN